MNFRRTIVIGDIHGCYQELLALLIECEFDAEQDRLIHVGDLVDRGPDSRSCVEFMMGRKAIPRERIVGVMGNHEEQQLKYYDKWLKMGAPANRDIVASQLGFRSEEHKRTFMQLSGGAAGPHCVDTALFEWMKTLPLYLQLPEYDAVIVHAGLLPDVPLERQDPFILRHVSNIREPERGGFDERGRVRHGYWPPKVETWWTSKAPEDSKFWSHFYNGCFGKVIFGHSAFMHKPMVHNGCYGIDTGGVFGDRLTALILPDWSFIQVECPRYHHDRPSDGRDIKLFEVAPGAFVFS